MEGRIPQIRVQGLHNNKLALERRLCIETILKEVCMDHLVEIFAKEEVSQR